MIKLLWYQHHSLEVTSSHLDLDTGYHLNLKPPTILIFSFIFRKFEEFIYSVPVNLQKLKLTETKHLGSARLLYVLYVTSLQCGA